MTVNELQNPMSVDVLDRFGMFNYALATRSNFIVTARDPRVCESTDFAYVAISESSHGVTRTSLQTPSRHRHVGVHK